MRALADFVMRGPVQAAGVAVAGAIIPLMFWISAAVVSLVLLRLGIQRGVQVGLWALLPALGWASFGNDPIAFVVLVEALVMATVLRLSQSWERTLLAGVLVALASGILMPLVMSDIIGELARAGVTLYEQVNPQLASEAGDTLFGMMQSLMVMSLSVSLMMMALGSLMLARGWQAQLYNPGGFRREFHALRLSKPMLLGCLAGMFLLPGLGLNPVLTSTLFVFPLVVAAIALIHGLLGTQANGRFWLILFYVALLMFGPTLLPLLLILAIVDSWLDFRARVRQD